MAELALVVLVIGLNNAMIFLAYALLFGFAGIRILMLRLTP